MREDLIAELRELCAIEGRLLTFGERVRTRIAMSAAAAALEAAREDAANSLGALRVAVIALASAAKVSQDYLPAYNHISAAIEQAREEVE